ncbi:MAG: hypothetical protein JSW43_03290 [Gemmatimonadota bacterium]|nr:MAG: hypothetical protein JSW43_03290 [Gemmatimonadota bacterium]
MHHTVRPVAGAVAAALTAAMLACSREAPTNRPEASTGQAEPTADLAGDWHLRPAAPLRPGPLGMRLTLTIDSVRDAQLYGRLVHYVSGNVGIDPARFRPFEGTVSAGALAIAIEDADPAGVGLGFAGQVSGDTIHLTTFALGADTLSRDAIWLLVRGEP